MKKCIAIYLRLSLEDVDKKTNQAKDESNSITAQRQLIRRYIEHNDDLSSLQQMEFCDDGFSGTTFERPDFQRMIDQIRNGEIQTVIVKDLSRFGRDYLEVGDYLEHIFPFLGVRMISVNDHYDSARYQGNTAGMDVAFRNLIYDYYSKDLSRKVKTAMRAKQREGGYVSLCLYGYKVSPDNKHRMVIDPVTAPVVRRIFTDIIAGKTTSQVARELNAEGIPTPQQYKGISRRKDQPSPAIWTHNRIIDMLKNLKYTGCMVNHTRESMTIRAKTQRKLPKEEWIIHENAHEAIVTRAEFDAAQAALRKVRHYKRKEEVREYPFYCAHCGRKLQRTYGYDDHFYCMMPYWKPDAELCKAVRWDKKDMENVIFESLKGQIAVMSVEPVSRDKDVIDEGTQIRQRIKALACEVEKGESQKVQKYIAYREGHLTKEGYIAARNDHEKSIAELKNQLAQAEKEYEEYLINREQTKKEQEIAKRTRAMNEDTLRERMYEAVERVEIEDDKSIKIVWKFDDLFAAIKEI